MEKFDGNIKKKYRNSFGVGWEKALIPLIGPLRAIQICHKNRIYHRDVKPENILYKADRVVLADLGLSSFKGLFGRPTFDGEVHGTLEFIHPIRYNHNISDNVLKYSDIYSWYLSWFDIALGSLPLKVRGNPIQPNFYRDGSFLYEVYANTPEPIRNEIGYLFLNENFAVNLSVKLLIHKILQIYPSLLENNLINKCINEILSDVRES
ncbi:MAG: hypothetical protein EPN82_12880 [Bacteroidetes bacterium]|nr:MAG: hypothetical protein EPN82_12880 [Bacteroidota bacterium]